MLKHLMGFFEPNQSNHTPEAVFLTELNQEKKLFIDFLMNEGLTIHQAYQRYNRIYEKLFDYPLPHKIKVMRKVRLILTTVPNLQSANNAV